VHCIYTTQIGKANCMSPNGPLCKGGGANVMELGTVTPVAADVGLSLDNKG